VPQINGAGSSNDQIAAQLANVSAAKAESVIGQNARLVTTTCVQDSSITIVPNVGYRPQITPLTADMLTNASASLDQNGTSWVVNLTYNSQGASILNTLTTKQYSACSQQGCPEQFMTQWLD